MCLKLLIIGIALLVFVTSSLGECNQDIQSKNCCPENETLYDHDYPCARDTCAKAFDDPAFYECKFVAQKSKFRYCNCNDNMFRNKDGYCVSIEQCLLEINGSI
uniref:Protease inibitor Lg2F7 n=1 Tax=Mayetiola destructor TaxID=39758 RepID=Q0QVT9_MAYDE|nr:protease inibitor Lg2F7 [Mayetiola destructor]